MTGGEREEEGGYAEKKVGDHNQRHFQQTEQAWLVGSVSLRVLGSELNGL